MLVDVCAMRTGWQEVKGRGRWVTVWQHKEMGFISLNAYPNGSWSITSKAMVGEGNPAGLVCHWSEVRAGIDLPTAMLMAENYARKLDAIPMGQSKERAA